MKKRSELVMRVKNIRVEEVDGEYFVWLDDNLLGLTRNQAQIMADKINAAIRARWKSAGSDMEQDWDPVEES